MILVTVMITTTICAFMKFWYFLLTGVNMEHHLASVCCNNERRDQMFENVSGFVVM